MTSGQTNSIYCPHCGTGNEPNASICDRCGERVYRPNVNQPPPLGLAGVRQVQRSKRSPRVLLRQLWPLDGIGRQDLTGRGHVAKPGHRTASDVSPNHKARSACASAPNAGAAGQRCHPEVSPADAGVAKFYRLGCRKRVWGSRRRTARIVKGIQLGGLFSWAQSGVCSTRCGSA